MHRPLQYTLEAHDRAATLYLHGTLLPSAVVGAFRACYQLPASVRRLRVELRGVDHAHREAGETLRLLARDWELARRGVARLEPPDERRRAS